MDYDEIAIRRAEKQVKKMKDFYSHLASYIIINGFLFGLNLLTSPDDLWFYWPMLGWGIGLAFNWYAVFGADLFLGKDWEERKTQELLDKDD